MAPTPTRPWTEEEFAEEAARLRQGVEVDKKQLKRVRKLSPPEGTPASRRSEGELLSAISDKNQQLEEVMRVWRAVQENNKLLEQLRPQVIQGETPQPSKSNNYAWLKYVIPPIATAVVAILSMKFVGREDFEKALQTQQESIKIVSDSVEKERQERAKLKECLSKVMAQNSDFQVVTLAGMEKLGIVIRGQTNRTQNVEWKSESMANSKTGSPARFVPVTLDKNEIQIVAVVCDL